MNRSMLCAALLSAAAMISGAVHAQALENVQRTVSARGVNFENVTQVRFFYAKLAAAAHDVCASELYDPLTQMADKACQDAALEEAVTQVDKPLLNRMTGHRRVELISRRSDAGNPQAALIVSGLDQ